MLMYVYRHEDFTSHILRMIINVEEF